MANRHCGDGTLGIKVASHAGPSLSALYAQQNSAYDRLHACRRVIHTDHVPRFWWHQLLVHLWPQIIDTPAPVHKGAGTGTSSPSAASDSPQAAPSASPSAPAGQNSSAGAVYLNPCPAPTGSLNLLLHQPATLSTAQLWS